MFKGDIIFILASRTWHIFKSSGNAWMHVIHIIQCNLKKVVIGRSRAWWFWVPMCPTIVLTYVCLYIALFSHLYILYTKSMYILKMFQSNFWVLMTLLLQVMCEIRYIQSIVTLWWERLFSVAYQWVVTEIFV